MKTTTKRLNKAQQRALADHIMTRACQLILTERQFDMTTFNGFERVDRGEYVFLHERNTPVCGTACCIGGNLAIAAKEYRIPGSKKYITVHYANRVWELFDRPSLDPDFHAHGMSLHRITPKMAVAHLVSGKPLSHFWDAESQRPNRRIERYVTKARKMIKELL